MLVADPGGGGGAIPATYPGPHYATSTNVVCVGGLPLCEGGMGGGGGGHSMGGPRWRLLPSCPAGLMAEYIGTDRGPTQTRHMLLRGMA